jgi:predicted O-methyltransferase YrrM
MHTIPFPLVDLSAVADPVPAILSAPEFRQTEEYFKANPASTRSLISPYGQALMFSLIRNAHPDHVVEIGSFKGGTTECLSRALDANGRGVIHTIGPFDSEHFLPVLESWPDNIRSRVRFYPTDSMSFFMRIQREGIRPWLVFVDGCHDYEFALFDIQCAARSLTPGGFIVVDNVSQVGPYFAALDFFKSTSGWLNCQWKPGAFDSTKAFDNERRAIINTDFFVLRAPNLYLLGDRPRTFGEVNWPSAAVHGLKLVLAETNKGTLHVQCVLRGFADTRNVELTSRLSVAIGGERDELTVMFEKPLVLEGNWSACRAEPWLIWMGASPLVLNEPPQII